MPPRRARASLPATSAPVAVSTDPDEEAAEVFDEQARQRSRLLRGYKIQEVIKRRQIMLVQVVKEERGNKGAALTTYLSLAGRYSVLMPNTGRGGGISRKIANPADRARLKAIAREIEVPEGMGLIIRTAGQQRSKLEIRRDYEYSLRLWNDIRELTLALGRAVHDPRGGRAGQARDPRPLRPRRRRGLGRGRGGLSDRPQGDEHADAVAGAHGSSPTRTSCRCSTATASRSSSTACISR